MVWYQMYSFWNWRIWAWTSSSTNLSNINVRVINLKDGDSIADIAKVVVDDVNSNGNTEAETSKDDEPTL